MQLKYPLKFLLKKMNTVMKVTVFWYVILGPSPDSHHSFGRESASAAFVAEKEF